MNTKELLPYIAPTIEVEIIELEQGIATASAFVSPHAEGDFVQEEWETEENKQYELNW
ncbi:hypothetical protein [Sphingobacterium alkalisoli]|uniref:hypothetical protein n=1 Tax=Sphingobacterium alkalisoli TaxID=1874115 RepID=UPI00145D54B0|nr:hypothetical protein [Sphingobacterium alkalisoli]